MAQAHFKKLEAGIIFDQSKNFYPAQYWGLKNSELSFKDDYNHTFGFVQSGEVEIKTPTHSTFKVSQGMYFSIPGPFDIHGKAEACLFKKFGHRGLFSIGGPLEAHGRLCYIDNCTTTVLSPAARLGDPCLNLLVFPPNVKQTLHIHPSLRYGIIVAGKGTCFNPQAGELQLKPGMVFCLEETYPHCFNSDKEGLVIVAFHPDSDMGPTDQQNPMLNRTYTRF